MMLKCKLSLLPKYILYTILLFHLSPGTLCASDVDSDRGKRTIGALFQTFVDVFQPQRQPAPMVTSFNPLKQTRASAPSRSVKTDLLSSSKNLFQQSIPKKNLFKPPSTQAPDVEVIPPSSPPPAPVSSPKPAPEPATQAAPLTGVDQPQIPPPNLTPTSAVNPFANFIPPPGHRPLTPLKAQILLLPLHENHGPGTPLGGFGLDSRLPPGGAPFNYQAEIYLHPPEGNVYPQPFLHQHYPARYSPASGWHDVDELLSQRAKPPGSDAKTNVGVVDLTQPKGRGEQPDYNGNEYQESNAKQSGTPNSNGGYYENEIESQRKETHYPNNFVKTEHKPLLDSPHDQYHKFVDEHFGYNFQSQIHGYQQAIDDFYKNSIPQDLRNIEVDHTNYGEDKGETRNAHDYKPQRGSGGKVDSHQSQQQYYQQPQRYHNNEHRPELASQQYSSQDVKPHDDVEVPYLFYPARVGRLPESVLDQQYQLHLPLDGSLSLHQAPPVHDSHMDYSEQSLVLPNSYQYKRSNKAHTKHH